MPKERNKTYSSDTQYQNDRATIVAYANSRIRCQEISGSLGKSDLCLASQAVADRCDTYWHKIPVERGRKSYLNRLVRHVLYEIAQKYTEKVQITCLPGSSLTCLLDDHSVSRYLTIHRGKDGMTHDFARGWLFPSQIEALRMDERVEHIQALGFRPNQVDRDLEQKRCPTHGQSRQMLRCDLASAIHALAKEWPRQGKIAVYRWLHGLSRAEAAKKLRLGVRRCDQLLKEFSDEFRIRFPEFRDYLRDLDRDVSG